VPWATRTTVVEAERPLTDIVVEEDIFFEKEEHAISLSQWPRGIRCGSAAAFFVGLWVRIPLGAWMYVCRECSVLSGRGHCVGLISRPEKTTECRGQCELES
jgi:hypothetical protein